MIVVERRGRLGNQIFQFAFGVAASRRLGTTFAMADDDLQSLFTLGPYGGAAGRTLRRLRFRVGRRLAPYPVVDEDDFASPEDLLAHLSDRRLYWGYFQSERFFAGAEADVVDALAFRPEHVRRFRERYPELLGVPYVCCHVRRTDYHDWLDGIVLPASYYRDSLALLAPAEGTPVVFVGDDFEELPQELADVPGARWERNDVATDLQLVAGAAAVVTSNSSFGWWGAYLNRAPGRRVVAPRHWIGFKEGVELPGDVIPAGWEQVAVRPVDAKV